MNHVVLRLGQDMTGARRLIVDGAGAKVIARGGSLNLIRVDDGSGRDVAHDVLEHVTGLDMIGDAHHELEAVGAGWYIRGQFGDYYRSGPEAAADTRVILANGLVGLFLNVLNHGVPFPLSYTHARATDADRAFDQALSLAARQARVSDGFQPHTDASAWNAYAPIAFHKMRAGYMKAAKRYRSARGVNALFWQIAHKVRSVYQDGRQEHDRRWRLSFGPWWAPDVCVESLN